MRLPESRSRGCCSRHSRDFPIWYPGDRVLFGDSSSDVEAAQRAGVPAVRMPANGSLEAAVQEWFLTGATLGRFVLSPTSTSLRRYSRMVCSHVRKLTGPPNRLLTEK